RGHSGHVRGAGRTGAYLALTAEVMDAITVDAFWNASSRSVMWWRRAIHSKSVYTAHTSPFWSWVTSRRTGQSSPALGLDVRNNVPSGGFPNTSSVEGCSFMPALSASSD